MKVRDEQLRHHGFAAARRTGRFEAGSTITSSGWLGVNADIVLRLVGMLGVVGKRPLSQHIDEFENYLANKGVGPKQVKSTISMLSKIEAGCKWKSITHITASSALTYLGDLRRKGRSAQTYNHYLKSAKQFTCWLVRDRRTPADALAFVARLNVATDRRHDRRALSPDEFTRLVEAARSGKKIEGISGPDRAMMYIVAAWTGFRKAELGSLTRQSLCLDGDPPTATIEACYSKHRRRDTQVLHPQVVSLVREWLATKRFLKPSQPLFPVSGRVAGGRDRKTYLMIRKDLEAARVKWLKESATISERRTREKSDFLAHKNHAGRFADFHSMRHFFITSLERAGISPKMAQTLARHSDIRLTLGVYTHVGIHEQTAAIGALAGPIANLAPPAMPRRAHVAG